MKYGIDVNRDNDFVDMHVNNADKNQNHHFIDEKYFSNLSNFIYYIHKYENKYESSLALENVLALDLGYHSAFIPS